MIFFSWQAMHYFLEFNHPESYSNTAHSLEMCALSTMLVGTTCFFVCLLQGFSTTQSQDSTTLVLQQKYLLQVDQMATTTSGISKAFLIKGQVFLSSSIPDNFVDTVMLFFSSNIDVLCHYHYQEVQLASLISNPGSS